MMPRFELRRLEIYDEDSLLTEIRRVAALIENPIISQAQFDRLSKASSSVIRKRFGTWENALNRAGLADRYSGTAVSRRMLAKARQIFTDEDLLTELRSVAVKCRDQPLTIERFNQISTKLNAETIRRRFGSWWKALDQAGLKISNLGKRYSEADYLENLLTVWTHYGRQPSYGEMDRPPSRIPSGAYEARWGTWRKALRAFIEKVNSDLAEGTDSSVVSGPGGRTDAPRAPLRERKRSSPKLQSRKRDVEPRKIRLGLRYDVLRRDRFRCVLCGASPASQVGCELHVDHIDPRARGGRTVPRNLRTLCSRCNVGKGVRVE